MPKHGNSKKVLCILKKPFAAEFGAMSSLISMVFWAGDFKVWYWI